MGDEIIVSLIEVGTMAITVVVTVILAVKYMLGQLEKERILRTENDNILHGRINEMRTNYIPKEDFNIHVDRIERGQAEQMRANNEQHNALAQSIERLHARFDKHVDNPSPCAPASKP